MIQITKIAKELQESLESLCEMREDDNNFDFDICIHNVYIEAEVNCTVIKHARYYEETNSHEGQVNNYEISKVKVSTFEKEYPNVAEKIMSKLKNYEWAC